MNNKAFTLIEFVGVILILAAIFLISFPAFLSLTKSDEEKSYNVMIKDLCMAGESYIYNNTDSFDISTVDSVITLSIGELISYGSVDSDLKNPKTNFKVSDDSLKYTVKSDNSLDCEYIENSD